MLPTAPPRTTIAARLIESFHSGDTLIDHLLLREYERARHYVEDRQSPTMFSRPVLPTPMRLTLPLLLTPLLGDCLSYFEHGDNVARSAATYPAFGFAWGPAHTTVNAYALFADAFIPTILSASSVVKAGSLGFQDDDAALVVGRLEATASWLRLTSARAKTEVLRSLKPHVLRAFDVGLAAFLREVFVANGFDSERTPAKVVADAHRRAGFPGAFTLHDLPSALAFVGVRQVKSSSLLYVTDADAHLAIKKMLEVNDGQA